MGEIVTEFIKTKRLLMDSFKCLDDYFIKNLENCNWSISNLDDWCLVSFWDKNKNGREIKTDIAVVKKNGVPQIFENEDYTMVIGIQCVKIAFIFDNKKKIC